MKNRETRRNDSLNIITETQGEYETIKTAAGFLESMFERRMNNPGAILWGIKKVLQEKKVHSAVKDFFGEARRLIYKYNRQPEEREDKKPYYNQQRRRIDRKYAQVSYESGRDRRPWKPAANQYVKTRRKY